MRHYFDKCGGNLGQTGCVGFLFEKKGVLVIDGEDLDEDQVMEDALEAGAADFLADEDVYEIRTEPEDFTAVMEALEAKGYRFESAEQAQVPSTTTAIADEEMAAKMEKLLDMLEDNDDVQNVWHNWEQ